MQDQTLRGFRHLVPDIVVSLYTAVIYQEANISTFVKNQGTASLPFYVESVLTEVVNIYRPRKHFTRDVSQRQRFRVDICHAS